MEKFANWLESEPGRSTRLAKYIGRHRSFISNIKAGRKKLPHKLIRHVVEFSGGELTLDDLVIHAPLKRGTV